MDHEILVLLFTLRRHTQRWSSFYYRQTDNSAKCQIFLFSSFAVGCCVHQHGVTATCIQWSGRALNKRSWCSNPGLQGGFPVQLCYSGGCCCEGGRVAVNTCRLVTIKANILLRFCFPLRWHHETRYNWMDDEMASKKCGAVTAHMVSSWLFLFCFFHTGLLNSISAGELVSGLLQLPAGRLWSAAPYQSAGGDGCKLDLLSGVSFNRHSWVGWQASSCASSSRSDNPCSEETPRRLAGKLWLLCDPLCVLIRSLDFSFFPAAGPALRPVCISAPRLIVNLPQLPCQPHCVWSPPPPSPSQMTRQVRSQKQPASLKTFQSKQDLMSAKV